MHYKITFRITLSYDSNLYLIEGFIFTGVRIPFITIAHFTFLWICISMYRRLLLYSVCIGPTACLHRYLLPIIAGTNTVLSDGITSYTTI